MILAVKKYGTRVGIQKGIKRIISCKIPNGGIDYP
jgi:putative component of membrane protein insertase Oxa1/YidC/SpoIIIJ protein YidD